jgi:hypothetical protein
MECVWSTIDVLGIWQTLFIALQNNVVNHGAKTVSLITVGVTTFSLTRNKTRNSAQ